MRLHKALQQSDKNEFITAMKSELQEHIDRKHWNIMPMKNVPKHKTAIPMVYLMKRKRNPLGEIIKWKVWLCAGGHRLRICRLLGNVFSWSLLADYPSGANTCFNQRLAY